METTMTLSTWRLLAACMLPPLLSACLDKDKIATVPDAENQLFTPDGRLIVTGGTGVFEIKRTGAGPVAEAASADVNGACNFTGLAQIGDWVFTACQQRPGGLLAAPDNHLLAARVEAGRPLHFVQVERAVPDPMDQLAIPNGLAATPTGQLLIADYNLFASAAVARATLDLGGAVPRLAALEKNWLGPAHGISHPNGVRVKGNELFVSDVYFVKRYQFDAAGNVPLYITSPSGSTVKNEALVYQGATVLDDIQPYCGGVIISDFLGGRLVYAAPNGADAQGMPTWRVGLYSGLQSLQQPSSVIVGRGPLFSGYDLLVTEKGVLGEFSSDYGNKLSRVKSSIDLNSPLACAQVNAY
jgi:hypothetical protein